MPAAMPCKTPVNCRGETLGNARPKYACIVGADESMRIRLEGIPQRYHEDHIAAKGMNSLSNYTLVQKFSSMPQALINNGCKGSSGKIMGKLEKNTGMAADESQKKERSDR